MVCDTEQVTRNGVVRKVGSRKVSTRLEVAWYVSPGTVEVLCMWAVTRVTRARETVEGLVSAECMCCYAMMSTVVKSVRTS